MLIQFQDVMNNEKIFTWLDLHITTQLHKISSYKFFNLEPLYNIRQRLMYSIS